MSKLIYAMNMTLDGYVADEHGAVDLVPMDADVFADHTELHRSIGTILYGRRLYETMAVWETDPELAATSPAMADFSAAWKRPVKIVYSTTLTTPITDNSRIERALDIEQVRTLKRTTAGDLMIGGPELAGQAIQAGVVDELHLYVLPLILGAGTLCLPSGHRTDLELVDERRFGNGVTRLRYRCLES